MFVMCRWTVRTLRTIWSAISRLLLTRVAVVSPCSRSDYSEFRIAEGRALSGHYRWGRLRRLTHRDGMLPGRLARDERDQKRRGDQERREDEEDHARG